MLTNTIEQIERIGADLETAPVRAFRMCRRLAIEANAAGRAFGEHAARRERRRFIGNRFAAVASMCDRIETSIRMGDFYTTGEDLRAFGAALFLRAYRGPLKQPGTIPSPLPGESFLPHREAQRDGPTSPLVSSIWSSG